MDIFGLIKWARLRIPHFFDWSYQINLTVSERKLDLLFDFVEGLLVVAHRLEAETKCFVS